MAAAAAGTEPEATKADRGVVSLAAGARGLTAVGRLKCPPKLQKEKQREKQETRKPNEHGHSFTGVSKTELPTAMNTELSR